MYDNTHRELVKGSDGLYYPRDMNHRKMNTWRPPPDKFARRTVLFLFVIAGIALAWVHGLI